MHPSGPSDFDRPTQDGGPSGYDPTRQYPQQYPPQQYPPQQTPPPVSRTRLPILLAAGGLLLVGAAVVTFLLVGRVGDTPPVSTSSDPSTSAPASTLSADEQALVARMPVGVIDGPRCASAAQEATGDGAQYAVRCPAAKPDGAVESIYVAQYADAESMRAAFGPIATTRGTGAQCPTSPSAPTVFGSTSEGSFYCYYFTDGLARFTWTYGRQAIAVVARGLPTTSASGLYSWYVTHVSDGATPAPSAASAAPQAFSVAALEAKLRDVTKASGVRCTGPATPVAGGSYQCVASLAEGDLPLTVTTADPATLRFTYSGSVQTGSVRRTVSGSFSL